MSRYYLLAVYWSIRALAYWRMLKLHLMATLRFWQTLRRSRSSGFRESIAAASHLMLTRATRNAEQFEFPTFDPDQLTTGINISRPTGAPQ